VQDISVFERLFAARLRTLKPDDALNFLHKCYTASAVFVALRLFLPFIEKGRILHGLVKNI